MRTAIVQMPANRTDQERRHVARAAVRQLERAGIYLAAVAHMELDDRDAQRVLAQLRSELDGLRRHLARQR